MHTATRHEKEKQHITIISLFLSTDDQFTNSSIFFSVTRDSRINFITPYNLQHYILKAENGLLLNKEKFSNKACYSIRNEVKFSKWSRLIILTGPSRYRWCIAASRWYTQTLFDPKYWICISFSLPFYYLFKFA